MAKAPDAKAPATANATDAAAEANSKAAAAAARTQAELAPRPAAPKTAAKVDPVTGKEIEQKTYPKTGDATHRAVQTGYDSNGGQLIGEGELVPKGLPVSDVWMEKVKGKDSNVDRAAAEANQPRKDDANLEALGLAALQAIATLTGVADVTGLSKDDLIQVIQSSSEFRRL